MNPSTGGIVLLEQQQWPLTKVAWVLMRYHSGQIDAVNLEHRFSDDVESMISKLDANT